MILEVAEEQQRLRVEFRHIGGPGLIVNQTWGDGMLESYEAKWIQHAGRARVGELPPHGFKVFNPDGTIREICLHLRRHPLD